MMLSSMTAQTSSFASSFTPTLTSDYFFNEDTRTLPSSSSTALSQSSLTNTASHVANAYQKQNAQKQNPSSSPAAYVNASGAVDVNVAGARRQSTTSSSSAASVSANSSSRSRSSTSGDSNDSDSSPSASSPRAKHSSSSNATSNASSNRSRGAVLHVQASSSSSSSSASNSKQQSKVAQPKPMRAGAVDIVNSAEVLSTTNAYNPTSHLSSTQYPTTAPCSPISPKESQNSSSSNVASSTTQAIPIIRRPLSGLDGRVEYVGPFELGRVLGRGCTGTVRLGTHRETGFQVAFKIIEKKYLNSEPKLWRKVKREIAILKLIEHPHVLKLYDVLETEHRLYLVLEHVQGGELFDYIVSKGRLDRNESLRLTAQIVQGLEHCHTHSICHRDLKPENLLLDGENNIKIADFGMAQLMKHNSMLKTSCGSPHYASPEIIEGLNYDAKMTDVWSIGVILYALITGSLPFDHDNIPTLLSMVTKGFYTTPAHVPSDVSNLIARMLCVDPKRRIKLSEIRSHACYKNTLYFQPIKTSSWPYQLNASGSSPENKKRTIKKQALDTASSSANTDDDDNLDSVLDESLINDLEALGLGSGWNREELKARVVEGHSSSAAGAHHHQDGSYPHRHSTSSAEDGTLERKFYQLLKKRRNSRLLQLSMLSPKVSPTNRARTAAAAASSSSSSSSQPLSIGSSSLSAEQQAAMSLPLYARSQSEPDASLNVGFDTVLASRQYSGQSSSSTSSTSTPSSTDKHRKDAIDEQMAEGRWVSSQHSASSSPSTHYPQKLSPLALADEDENNLTPFDLSQSSSSSSSQSQPQTHRNRSDKDGVDAFMTASQASYQSAQDYYSRHPSQQQYYPANTNINTTTTSSTNTNAYSRTASRAMDPDLDAELTSTPTSPLPSEMEQDYMSNSAPNSRGQYLFPNSNVSHEQRRASVPVVHIQHYLDVQNTQANADAKTRSQRPSTASSSTSSTSTSPYQHHYQHQYQQQRPTQGYDMHENEMRTPTRKAVAIPSISISSQSSAYKSSSPEQHSHPHYTSTPRFHRVRLDPETEENNGSTSSASLLPSVNVASSAHKKKSWFSSIFSSKPTLDIFKRRGSVQENTLTPTTSTRHPTSYSVREVNEYGYETNKPVLSVADEIRKVLKSNASLGLSYRMDASNKSRFECHVDARLPHETVEEDEEENYSSSASSSSSSSTTSKRMFTAMANLVSKPAAASSRWSMRRFSLGSAEQKQAAAAAAASHQYYQQQSNAVMSQRRGSTSAVSSSSSNVKLQASQAPVSYAHARHQSVNLPVIAPSAASSSAFAPIAPLPLPPRPHYQRAYTNPDEINEFETSNSSFPAAPSHSSSLTFAIEISSSHDHRSVRFIPLQGNEEDFILWKRHLLQTIADLQSK